MSYDWREEFEFVQITDPAKILPGMKAKLVAGEEEYWGPQCWIRNNKGKVFEVSHYDEDMGRVGVFVPDEYIIKIPTELEDPNLIDGKAVCFGDLKWFRFSK